jgi:hypothetical protein
MIGALIILLALVLVGGVLYLFHLRDLRRGADAAPTMGAMKDVAPGDDTVCCGQHTVCEKDSLLTEMSDKIEYFDDEELDRFAGRSADSYEPDEVEEFRDVLLTLLPDDVAPWARSIQLRGIRLPTDVRDELLLIVEERRQGR